MPIRTDRPQVDEPFLSANDGTSAFAMLMEFAHHIKTLKLTSASILHLHGENTSSTTGPARISTSSVPTPFRDEYQRIDPSIIHRRRAIDMTAGKTRAFRGKQFAAHGQSVDPGHLGGLPAIEEPLFEPASARVLDESSALNRVGIPTTDMIELDYPHWHGSPTAENLLGETMSNDSSNRTWCRE